MQYHNQYTIPWILEWYPIWKYCSKLCNFSMPYFVGHSMSTHSPLGGHGIQFASNFLDWRIHLWKGKGQNFGCLYNSVLEIFKFRLNLNTWISCNFCLKRVVSLFMVPLSKTFVSTIKNVILFQKSSTPLFSETHFFSKITIYSMFSGRTSGKVDITTSRCLALPAK